MHYRRLTPAHLYLYSPRHQGRSYRLPVTEHERQAEPEPSEDLSASVWKPHPNSLRNLIPFTPGHSGNPSGLRKDGSSPKGSALRNALTDEIMRSGGMSAVAKRWVSLAKKGHAGAFQAILDRLDPIEKDSTQGKTILEGLKLELTAGGASLTMLSASTQPTTPQALTAAVAGESFADSEASESQEGGGPSGQNAQESPPTS